MTLEFSNWWGPPRDDPRFQGLLKISWIISDALDLSSRQTDIVRESEMNPEIYPFYTPLKLARLMREPAGRIESMTDRSQ